MKLNSSLFTLLATVAAALAFTACSNGDEITTPSESKVINYAPAKASKIYITSGDNVLGSVGGAISRGTDMNSNMWDSIPAYPTDAEKQGVMEYIASKPEGVEWPGYTKFLVQHVDGAHHNYSYQDMNGATLSMDGTQSMEMLSIIEADGTFVHVNNFNAGKGNNNASNDCVCMTNGFKGAYALNEWSSSAISAWRLFYWNDNYYLGLDYNMEKGDGKIDPDGCYDDWVVKIIPIYGEKRVYLESKTSVDPTDPSDESVDATDELKGMVEINLAVNEQKEKDDYVESKLSIHVRDTSDVEVFIPVPAEYYCEADDMYIIKNHIEGNWVYNESTQSVDMQVAGQTVTLTCTYSQEGITVKTSGINATVLKELRANYGDGINFEIWNYYEAAADRATIKKWLDLSTVKFMSPITEYINTLNNNETYNLDCIVTRKD